ncbi:uncharacterized protein LOC143030016 [Oratosquilla oratoria]|uniref:uncharacterized protein LOC143030016 n=1 Tax=Oratosquilla oratoria TaxID=337810 RepID=UPI003F75FA79
MKAIGVSPAMYNFIRSFLSNQYIEVRRKGVLSRRTQVDMGVLQGSVVSPLLLTLLLADLGKGVRGDTVVTAYKDDIALWRKSRHRRPKKNSAQHKPELRRFQEQVDVVVAQLNSLGFTLSAKKIVYMPMHLAGYNSGIYPGWNLKNICGTPVEPAKSVRYLGVLF